MTPEIRQNIFNYVKESLPEEFDGKLYWGNERLDEAQKPFCLLRAIIPEQNDYPSAERELSGNNQELTMFKNCVVTMSIFVDGISEKGDLDVMNEFAYTTANNLKNSLEWLDTAFALSVEGLSVNSISSLRDLTFPVSGGYTYRYEFDVTFGYNEVLIIHKEVGKDINLQIEREIND